MLFSVCLWYEREMKQKNVKTFKEYDYFWHYRLTSIKSEKLKMVSLQSACLDIYIFQSVFYVQGFHQPSQPWWRIKLFVWEPVLFGTWDGVFTTCMINIFGVVLFLRTGYLVVRLHSLSVHDNLFS